MERETSRANHYENIASMVDSAKERCQQLQSEIETKEAKIESLSSELEKASGLISLYVVRVKALEEGVQRKNNELEDVIQDLEAKQKELDHKNDEIKEFQGSEVRLQAYKIKLAESKKHIMELTSCLGKM